MSVTTRDEAPFRSGLFLAGVAAFVIPMIAVGLSGADWRGLAPATCMPDHCFCERVGDGPIRQPANSWSNLGFVLVGMLIVARREPSGASGLAGDPILRTLFGVLVWFLGIGSGAYHATLSFGGQWVDVMSMYLMPTFVILLNVSRVRPLAFPTFLGLYLGVNGVLGALLVTVPEARRYLFAGVVVALIASEIWSRGKIRVARDGRLFAASAGALAVSFAIWNLDRGHIVCAPESLLQGHALWHLGCAACTGLLYLYYRSERALPAATPA